MDTSSLVLTHLAGASVRVLGIALLAQGGLWLGRVRSASLRHAVWTVALGAMLLMPLLTRVVPELPVWIQRGTPEAISAQPARAAIAVIGAAGAVARSGATRLNWTQTGLALYLGVLLAMLGRLAVGLRMVRKLRRSAVPACDAFWESGEIAVPMAVGFFFPRILLPSGWREWGKEKLDAALAHESAHIRRGDPLIALLAALNKCIFWFHPLAWYLERRLAWLAEEAADDSTLLILGDRSMYAATLLEMATATQGCRTRLLWEGLAMARPAQIQRRIERILDESTRLSRTLSKGRWLALLLPGLAALYGAAAVQFRAEPPPIPGPFQRWLEEDAAYILTDAERASFLALSSDDERDGFIEQFWLRKDPTPASGRNEFKQEHHRRISYANQRFQEARPGWQTDRGRVYITFGPPDEVESYPAARYEIWKYRRIEGAGTNVELRFEDPASTGEYGLAEHTRLDIPVLFPPSRTETLAASWFTCSVSVLAHPWEGPDSFVAQVDVVFDSEQLPFQRMGGLERAVVNLEGRVVSYEQRVVNVFQEVLTVERPAGLPRPGQRKYQRRMPLPPGSYVLRFVATDPAGGRSEFRELPFTVR